jgi:hypothetical protein
MAQYSGNLITGNAVVAANYRRAMAPFSNFGTRQIAFLAIQNLAVTTLSTDAYVDVSDTTNVGGTGETYSINDAGGFIVVPETGIYVTNSHIAKAISGIQLAAEVCFVGDVAFTGSAPSEKAALVVGIYVDTAASANADQQHAVMANANARSIQQAVIDATGDASVTVQPVFPAGITFTPTGHAY